MSYRNEFFSKIKEIVIKARKENSDIIEAMPINEERAIAYKNSQYRMLPNRKNLSEERYCEIIDQGLQIGRECVRELMLAFQDRITVNTMGHNGIKDDIAFTDFAESYDFSIENVCRAIGKEFAMLVCNAPDNIADMDAEDFVGRSAFLIDPISDNFYLYGDACDFSCGDCGQELRFQLNPETLRVELAYTFDGYEVVDGRNVFKNKNPSECEYSDGLKEYSVEIDVPSGKLVLANNISALLSKDVRDKRYSYMSDKMGRYSSISESKKANVVHSQFYEELGIMYLQGSNAHPSIFKNSKNGLITIKKSERYNEETGDFDPNHTDDEELVGDICMDLWASTAADYEVFVKLCDEGGFSVDEMIKKLDVTIIDIASGRYKATNFYFSDRHKSEGLFAQIELAN